MKKMSIVYSLFFLFLSIFPMNSKAQEWPDSLLILRESLYNLDVEDSTSRNHKDIERKWVKISDDYLLKLFNESMAITQIEGKLIFNCHDNKEVIFNEDSHINKYYELWFYSSTTDQGNEEITPNRMIVSIRPINFNENTYYFVAMVRLVDRVEEYGTFRIVIRESNKYHIIVRQEDVLPSLMDLDRKNELDKKSINRDKFGWMPGMHFKAPEPRNGKLFFTFWYVFGQSPNGGGCPRVVTIDWKFDGKKMTPLKLNVLPWEDCLVDETKKIHREGKEFIINHE